MSHVQKGEKTATRGDLDTEVTRTFNNEVKNDVSTMYYLTLKRCNMNSQMFY